jgi:RNA processing factor Prp31
VTSLLNDTAHPLYETRDKLNRYINKLDDYYQLVKSTHDRDLLKAYKEDMLKYKKQLAKLKQQAEDAAGALLRDDKVTNLQH